MAYTIGILVLVLTNTVLASYKLTILHTNDVHDRKEQFDAFNGKCSNEQSTSGSCYGGVARTATAVNDIRASVDNVLLLDAGDQFQGTEWFVHYDGRATAYFMNLLGYNAQVLGNHEFDNGPDDLAAFLKQVNFPVISSNIDASMEPALFGLFNKSVVIDVGGEKIGIVGYTYQNSGDVIASIGNLIFEDEIEYVQPEVDLLISQGINKIIALGHSGILKDLEIAAKVRGIDIVVGGHSDTFLYTGEPPDAEIPYGDYPLVVTPKDDPEGTVLVVSAYAFGKYLGRLDVTFDDDGRVTEWGGNPILLNSDIPEDQEVRAEVDEWAEGFRNLSEVVAGSTHAHLDGERRSCRLRECNMGNMLTDAYIWSLQQSLPDEDKWTDVSIAMHLGGSIRSSIAAGPITFGDILKVIPFGNTIDTLELEGRYIKEILENSVVNYNKDDPPGRFIQFSGLWVVYDLSRHQNDRVVDVQVRCRNCSYPEFVPLEQDKTYKIAMASFIADGGEGYSVVLKHRQNHYTGNLDVSVIMDYLNQFSPVYPGVERRITFINEGMKEETVEPTKERKWKNRMPDRKIRKHKGL